MGRRTGAVLNFSQPSFPLTHEEHVHGQPKILDEIGSKVSELLANSPAKDLEKNARALLASGFSKLDLVTREEFEVQREVLAHTREKLADLEHRVARLEAELASRPPAQD
jgi:BMFP domain-containing protein YqiC